MNRVQLVWIGIMVGFLLGIFAGRYSYRDMIHQHGFIGDNMHCDGAFTPDAKTHERQFFNCWGTLPEDEK